MPDTIRVNLPDGRVVHFPASMATNEITREVEGLVSKVRTADSKPDPFAGRFDPGGAPASELWRRVRENPAKTGAIAGGLLAAPFTGGMSAVPAMLAQGAAGAGGAAIGMGVDAVRGGPSRSASAMDNLKTIGTEGALSAGGEGAARGLSAGVRAAAGPMRDMAVSSYERMLKPTRSALNSMVRFGETLPERSRNISSAILDSGVNISKAGSRQMHDMIGALSDKASAMLANSDKRGPTSLITNALKEAESRVSRQLAPNADRSAVRNVASEVESNPLITTRVRGRETVGWDDTNPADPIRIQETVDTGRRKLLPTVTVQKLDQLKRGTYRALGDKSYGEMKGASVEGEKAAARGAKEAIEAVVPGVKPIHAQESQLIDQSQVLDDAVFRSGKHVPFGLLEDIVLSGHHPGALPAVLMNRPGLGSPIARAMNSASKAASQSVPHGNLIRSILIALMGSEPGSDRPHQ